MVTIKKEPKVTFGKNYDTAQIYSKGYEFALATKKSKSSNVFYQATPFVFCKDFLHDAVWAFLNKGQVNIYGFHYKHGKDLDLYLDNTLLLFRNEEYSGNKKKQFHSVMDNCLEFLRKAEKKMKFKPTKIHQVDEGDIPCWLIVGDKKWQHAPPLLSLYTLFIRLGCFHTPGDSVTKTLEKARDKKIGVKSGSFESYSGSNDCSYVKSAKEGIEVMLKKGLEIFHEKQTDNYPSSVAGMNLHNNCGVVNFSKKTLQKQIPHWFRSECWNTK